MVVPYLRTFAYFSDARVMIALTAILHIIFSNISTKLSFRWFNKNVIVVKYLDPYGARIMRYIYKTHINMVGNIRLMSVSKKKEIIEKLKKDITVTYENHKIFINIGKILKLIITPSLFVNINCTYGL